MYGRDDANIAAVQPVAIVGAALRFPGARDPVSFHELTTSGRRMFRELARTAVDHGRVYANGTGPLFSLDGVPLRAAMLDGDGTPESLDGSQASNGAAGRHVLAAEIAAAALADVPTSGRVPLSRTGAIIAEATEPGRPRLGGWVRDRMGLAESGADAWSGLDERGYLGGAHPSCSLGAVAAACEALNAGELDLMLAGGVSTGIDPDWLSDRARAGGLATREMRIYDTSPSGTLPGEGCGVVALMRAADARSAGLPIYAEIAGWHTAPGTSVEPLAPWPAYERSGIDPVDVQFVEGHGAATADDDLAELSALTEVLSGRVARAFGRCALGAVPANIGDTRSAAGVAALLKTALAMAAGTIPATTGCVRPHRLLRTETTPFRLPSVAEPWPGTPFQVAAVNSLGVAPFPGAPRSGAVHVVLRREQHAGLLSGRRRRSAAAPRGAVPAFVTATIRLVSAAPHAGVQMIPPRPRLPQDSRSPRTETQAEAAARAADGSQSGRSGMSAEPSARSFTPSTWCN
jgi:hypothetical protein